MKDELSCMQDAGLTDTECDLVRRRDWRGLIHYGVIFFMLEKLGGVIGVSNLHIYAAMRGETLEAFQQTRNAPGALYSVAGRDATSLSWNDPPHGRSRSAEIRARSPASIEPELGARAQLLRCVAHTAKMR